MLFKTKAIVLGHIAYRESSIILKLYTEKFGVQSYIENGVRTAKGKNKMALFQPMTLLDLVVYHHHKKDLHRMAEVKCSSPLVSIPMDIRKSCISLFLNEILNKTLKEHTENEPLFFFIYRSILHLDEAQENVENFHLFFLLKYCAFLGFAPQNALEIENQFREFGLILPFDADTHRILNLLIRTDFEEKIPLSKQFRGHLLQILLSFYKLHQEDFGELKSLAVLKEVFS